MNEFIEYLSGKRLYLQSLDKIHDPETAHSEADAVLIEIIQELAKRLDVDVDGIIEAYDDLEKWYS